MWLCQRYILPVASFYINSVLAKHACLGVPERCMVLSHRNTVICRAISSTPVPFISFHTYSAPDMHVCLSVEWHFCCRLNNGMAASLHRVAKLTATLQQDPDVAFLLGRVVSAPTDLLMPKALR